MIHFRKAITSEAKPLVGYYSESGCGKTKSALLTCKGFAGDMSLVGMIETESGRGEAYANDPVVGGYQVLPLRSEFSPKAYGAAIKAAEDAKLQCLIVDSASHEWEGVGGVLSMAAEAQSEGKKGPLVWQRAKMDHAREFMLRLTQTSIPLVVVCMRAKYTMEEVVINGKKEWQRSKILSPKQSEDILYEMFIHGWIDQEHKFHGTKYTLDVLRDVFRDNECITVETGQRLAAWARGGSAKTPSDTGVMGTTSLASLSGHISAREAADLEAYCSEMKVPVAGLLKAAGVSSLASLPDFTRAKAWVDKQVAARKDSEAYGAATRG